MKLKSVIIVVMALLLVGCSKELPVDPREPINTEHEVIENIDLADFDLEDSEEKDPVEIEHEHSEKIDPTESEHHIQELEQNLKEIALLKEQLSDKDEELISARETIQQQLEELTALQADLSQVKWTQRKLNEELVKLELYKETLKRSFTIQHVPTEIIEHDEAVALIYSTVVFTNGALKYGSLHCNYEERFEHMERVIDKDIYSLDTFRKYLIDHFYTEETAEEIMKRFIIFDNNTPEYARYLAIDDKLFGLCGDSGKGGILEYWDASLLELITTSDNNERFTFNLILPAVVWGYEFETDQIIFIEYQIEFVKVDGEWRINTDLYDFA